MVPASQLQSEFEAGFKHGKEITASKVKVKEIVRWQTKEVSTPTSPCGDPGEGLSVKASVEEAKVEDAEGTPYLTGRVGVDLSYPFRGWESHVDLPIDRTKVDFRIAKPDVEKQLPIPRKWHLGMAVGCGVGGTASVNITPSTDAGVGVGAMCGVMWGLVK